MNRIVVIRHYRPGDESVCRQLVKIGTMSTVWPAFWTALTRETFLQVIVVLAAIMFIFVHLPPLICLLAIPASVALIFIVIYVAHWIKASSIDVDMNSIPRNYMSSALTGFWVAEAFESVNNKNLPIKIVHESSFPDVFDDFYTRKVIGTIGVVPSFNQLSSSRIRRLTVHPNYKRNGIASALVSTAVEFCRFKGFNSVELVTTECHSEARALYLKQGFELRQLYHKQLVPYFVQILMYEFTLNLV